MFRLRFRRDTKSSSNRFGVSADYFFSQFWTYFANGFQIKTMGPFQYKDSVSRQDQGVHIKIL